MIPATKADEVYQTLKTEIMHFAVQPGMPLREVELSERFGISRTPIREAIWRLVSDGLATMTTNRGSTVSPILMQDVLEAYDVRQLLEPTAAGLAASRMDAKEIDRLTALLDERPTGNPSRDEIIRELEIDEAVHDGILSTANNLMLWRIVKDMRTRTSRVSFILPPGRLEESREQMRQIMEAIAARDATTAEAVMAEHIRKAKLRLVGGNINMHIGGGIS